MYRLKVLKTLNLRQCTVEPGAVIVMSHLGSATDKVQRGFCEFVKEKKRGKPKASAKQVPESDTVADSGASE